jgi:wyosine [tRNA(Phe)-imidazoG37] synthetase (radical SAM superfamily)
MPSPVDIIIELRKALERLDKDTIDVLTFSGTGEPTLNMNIREILTSAREVVDNLPIILLTNASLLSRRGTREAISSFDIITAKYDAGDEDTFRRINRPARGAFTLHDIQEGIIQLQREMKGILALEVMLLRGPRGLSNIEGTPRKALIEGILEVNPDLVQIYTPWRPSAVESVKPVSSRTLHEFGDDLEEHFGKERLWIYGIHDARGRGVKWRSHYNLEEEIMELLRRRPCRIADITNSLDLQPSTTTCIIGKLQVAGRVRAKRIQTDVFYEAK